MNWHDIALVMAAVIGTHVAQFVSNRIMLPYSWSCPECGFSAQAKQKRIIQVVRSAHNHA